MAHLTKPERYNIEDSNIALLGSDIEKNVREHAGDKETAWENAGEKPGTQVWRIENFHVVPLPEKQYGSFYDGDSYIVLHTYKKSPDSDALGYDLHFWLGENTSQDEAGTAAYKTVELDDQLQGVPIQYREVQDNESNRFLSYFPRFQCLKGGVASGFHHVTDPPPLDIHRLYRVSAITFHGKSSLIVREVVPQAASLVEGDVYVLDKGAKILQLNTKESVGKEKFKAAEFVKSLVDARQTTLQGGCEVTVFDEGSGSGIFLAEFGHGVTLQRSSAQPADTEKQPLLFRLSDSTGTVTFEKVEPVNSSSLHSSDAFIFDLSSSVYVWLGSQSSLTERRLAGQYAQSYIYQKGGNHRIPIVRVKEGAEDEDFLNALN